VAAISVINVADAKDGINVDVRMIDVNASVETYRYFYITTV